MTVDVVVATRDLILRRREISVVPANDANISAKLEGSGVVTTSTLNVADPNGFRTLKSGIPSVSTFPRIVTVPVWIPSGSVYGSFTVTEKS